MNTNPQTKIIFRGLQMTPLDIPFENGSFFVTIFLGCQGHKQMSNRLLNIGWFYLHAAQSVAPLFHLLGISTSIHWALFLKHGWSTLWKYSTSTVRLSLLQGVHWECKSFVQGSRNGVSGVKDNIFSLFSYKCRTT